MKSSRERRSSRIVSCAPVSQLLAYLSNPRPTVRRNAVMALVDLPSRSPVMPIIRLLGDIDPRVRRAAATTLGQMKARRAVNPILPLLQDKHLTVRVAAATALGSIGDPRVIRPLIETFSDRWRAMNGSIEALAVIGTPSIPHLLEALSHSDFRVRQCAIRALGEMRAHCALSELVCALKDRFHAVQRAAQHALVKLGRRHVGQLGRMLNSPSLRIGRGVVEVLKGLKATEELVQAARNGESFTRVFAIEALVEWGDPRAVEPLLACLRSEHSRIRARAALRLRAYQDSRAVPALAKLLKDPDSWVRWCATGTLQELRDVRAVGAIEDALLNEQDRSVRFHLAYTLEILLGGDAIISHWDTLDSHRAN